MIASPAVHVCCGSCGVPRLFSFLKCLRLTNKHNLSIKVTLQLLVCPSHLLFLNKIVYLQHGVNWNSWSYQLFTVIVTKNILKCKLDADILFLLWFISYLHRIKSLTSILNYNLYSRNLIYYKKKLIMQYFEYYDPIVSVICHCRILKTHAVTCLPFVGSKWTKSCD